MLTCSRLPRPVSPTPPSSPSISAEPNYRLLQKATEAAEQVNEASRRMEQNSLTRFSSSSSFTVPVRPVIISGAQQSHAHAMGSITTRRDHTDNAQDVPTGVFDSPSMASTDGMFEGVRGGDNIHLGRSPMFHVENASLETLLLPDPSVEDFTAVQAPVIFEGALGNRFAFFDVSNWGLGNWSLLRRATSAEAAAVEATAIGAVERAFPSVTEGLNILGEEARNNADADAGPTTIPLMGPDSLGEHARMHILHFSHDEQHSETDSEVDITGSNHHYQIV